MFNPEAGGPQPAVRPHVIRAGKRVPARPLASSDMRPDVVRDHIGTRWLAGTFSFDASRVPSCCIAFPPSLNCAAPTASRSNGWM